MSDETTDPFAEPCYACDALTSTNRVCTACSDPCCEEHFVSVEGIVYCVECNAEDARYFSEEEN